MPIGPRKVVGSGGSESVGTLEDEYIYCIYTKYKVYTVYILYTLYIYVRLCTFICLFFFCIFRGAVSCGYVQQAVGSACVQTGVRPFFWRRTWSTPKQKRRVRGAPPIVAIRLVLHHAHNNNTPPPSPPMIMPSRSEVPLSHHACDISRSRPRSLLRTAPCGPYVVLRRVQ